jgi:thymidylate kinase
LGDEKMLSDREFKIVSFSGIDGAGKSTQIGALQNRLSELGLRSTVLTFWDDIVVLGRFRESISHKAFGGDKGVGSPEKPISRRDKNVTSTHVIAARLFLYFLDALYLRLFCLTLRKTDADVVIFDRYVYDELANLPLDHWFARWYVRVILSIVPQPDISYLLDADPVAALARKPEYPLEFLRQNRERYLALSSLAGNMRVIEPLSVEAAKARVMEAWKDVRSKSPHSAAMLKVPASEV